MAGQIAQQPDSNHGFAVSAVPDSNRVSKGSLTMAWWALCSAMFWLVVSATLAINFGTKNALIGLVISVIVYGVINAVITRFAIKTGLSVALFSRVLFGSSGASLATFLFFATAIYYCVFEGSVIAVAIQNYFPSLQLWHAYLIVVLYSVPLVFGGVQNWLDRFNGFLLPFYIVGLFGAVGFTVYQYGYSNDWLNLLPEEGAQKYGWWNCVTYFMGVWVMMMYTWDYARYGKKEDVEYHARFNFGIPFYLFTFLINGVIGIFLAASIPTQGGVSEISVVLALLQLMGIFGLFFVWVSQTRINTANFYLATINMDTFFQETLKLKLPKSIWAIVVGAIVYMVMLIDIFQFILQALAYQGIFIVAWVVIALTHIAKQRGKEADDICKAVNIENTQRYNIGGVTAWFLSSFIGIFVLETDWSHSAQPITAVLAFGIYWLMLSKSELEL